VELSVPLIPPSVLILVRLNIDGEGNPSTGYTKQAYTALNRTIQSQDSFL